MVYIRVLGSCTAERNGEAVPLGGHRQRSVLALLVSERGRVVSVDRMIEELWQGAAPARAVASLQAYVSNLRRLLEPGRAPRTPARLLVSAPPGYALRMPEDAVDAWRFERLLGEARRRATTEPGAARSLLREALALWRGPAYADFADEPWTRSEIMRLGELRLAARELAVRTGLGGPAGAEAVAEAALLTGEEPLREEAWRLHALALWAAGRQADALATLRRARAVLAEEAGLDPGPALVELEKAVLAQDNGLLREATDAALPGGVAARLPGQGPGPGSGPGPGPAEPAAERSAPAAPADGVPPRGGPADGVPPRGGPAPHGTAVGEPAVGGPDDGMDLFVGRDEEIGRLAAAAHRALTAGPAVALVTGEAGLGKSALLHRLGDRLRADGWLVAVGRTTDAEGAPPAWAWVEALRTVAAAAPPAPGAAAVLAPLLAEGAPAASRPAGEDVAVGRFRLHRAVWQWLTEAARGRPVALLLDDLHWADAETLALLSGTVDLAPGTPLLVVGAYRPDEVEGRLGDTLAALARRSPARVALRGLAEESVAEVVRAVGGPREVDAETVAALTERTGGNPFYVRESARLLGSEGSLVALSEVPEGVRDVLRRRLGRLPDPVVSVLRLAAVAGRESAVEVLVESADADEDAVLGALEAGLLAGLLVEPDPGRIRFAHALVRDTLLTDLSHLRSSRMHGRIGASLEHLGSCDVSALAHHYARAASAATAAKAVDHCLRAAALAESRYAHDVAASVLAEAVACADRIPAAAGGDREAERAGLLGRLVRAQGRAGAVMAARETRRTAIDRAVGAGREDRLIGAFTAWSEPTPWQTRPYGTVDKPVVEILERLLERPGRLEPAVRCRLLGAYAAELSDAKLPAVRAAAREALALAEGLGDPVLRAGALTTLVKELDADREWPERAELGRELERLGAAHDLPAHAWYGMFIRSTALGAQGDVAGAHRLLGQCTEFARARRMPGPLAVGETAAATLAHVEGRVEEAERRYRQSAARMARQGSPHAEGILVVAIATLRASQGRLAQELPWAREVYAAFGSPAADLLAVALAAAGEAEEAREVLAQAGPLRTDYLFKVFGTFRAMTLVLLGERRGAEELYAALLPYRDAPPPSSGFTVAVRPVARTLGELAALLGRETEAAEHFRRARVIAEQWRSPWGPPEPEPAA
ncbi:BTAD domain-containing putative transcriptional regulator [Streptomyces sp. ICC1]|uniref:BTAD domain-containing putative transcriptional regulator n=1 Tax=Streptomyces sp. ICC1 TaxID=2099583 RepID=UPI000DC76262|nr:BTAD domain-containing putative transcriptional regulator [Streptomyces sp. ICC1]AWZ16355.1 transcriptional regulator [Streptomyces sp. ICC1]